MMDEESITSELKEKIEQVAEHAGWNMYLALSTAFLAVFAAIASLLSGSYSNQALLEKNNAVLFQTKASDQYAFYQAKGIKKNIDQVFFQQNQDQTLKKEIDRYATEQNAIQKIADSYVKQVEDANKKSEKLFEKHHQLALSVTFFQIAIALSAMSALLKRKILWYFSLLLAVIGIGYLIIGILLK